MAAKVYKLLFFLIGIGTVGYMIYAMGLDTMWKNIRATGSWFIPILLSWLVIYVMNALGFQAIIVEKNKHDTHIPFLRILQLTISGYAINYVTPFVALGGEPYRIMELEPRLGAAKASSSVLLYSLMHMFSHIVFWLLSTVLILTMLPLNGLLVGSCVMMLVLGGGLCFWFTRVYKKGFTVSVLRALSRLPWVGSRITKLIADKQTVLEEIDQQIVELYSCRRSAFYRSLFWELGARVVGCAEIFFTAIAIGLEMSVADALVVSSASSLFANVLFFFPMQLGTREGGFVLALKAIGMAGSHGIFIGVVTRIREISWIVIGLLIMGKSKRPMKQTPVVLGETVKQ